MTIITDSDLHDSLCQICIESPHSLLSELGYAAKQKIIETTVCISYKKGDLIYQEGDMPTGLHCLLTGKAKIYKEGIGGRQQIVRMAKPIGFIGYRAFFAEEIHIASAEALEDSIVCRIKTELILDIVRTTPDLAMSIIRALATDLGFSHRRTVTLTTTTSFICRSIKGPPVTAAAKPHKVEYQRKGCDPYAGKQRLLTGRAVRPAAIHAGNAAPRRE